MISMSFNGECFSDIEKMSRIDCLVNFLCRPFQYAQLHDDHRWSLKKLKNLEVLIISNFKTGNKDLRA